MNVLTFIAFRSIMVTSNEIIYETQAKWHEAYKMTEFNKEARNTAIYYGLINLIPIVAATFPSDEINIRGSRITHDVLQHFGIPVVPVMTRVWIGNEGMAQYVQLRGRMPRSKEELALATEQYAGWSMGIGYDVNTSDIAEGKTGDGEGEGFAPPKPKGQIALVVDGKYFLDTTIFRASRPAVNITLASVFAEVSPDWLGSPRGLMTFSNKCILSYQQTQLSAEAGTDVFASAEWNDKSKTMRPSLDIIRQLEAAVNEARIAINAQAEAQRVAAAETAERETRRAASRKTYDI